MAHLIGSRRPENRSVTIILKCGSENFEWATRCIKIFTFFKVIDVECMCVWVPVNIVRKFSSNFSYFIFHMFHILWNSFVTSVFVDFCTALSFKKIFVRDVRVLKICADTKIQQTHSENWLNFVYAPSCVSFFYATNCINAPPKLN